MSFQKCPICNGTGTVNGFGMDTFNECPTCLGARIISESTGRPSEQYVTERNMRIRKSQNADMSRISKLMNEPKTFPGFDSDK